MGRLRAAHQHEVEPCQAATLGALPFGEARPRARRPRSLRPRCGSRRRSWPTSTCRAPEGARALRLHRCRPPA
eukprot:11474931-Alexandrium_andersonii.AAC.1